MRSKPSTHEDLVKVLGAKTPASRGTAEHEHRLHEWFVGQFDTLYFYYNTCYIRAHVADGLVNLEIRTARPWAGACDQRTLAAADGVPLKDVSKRLRSLKQEVRTELRRNRTELLETAASLEADQLALAE